MLIKPTNNPNVVNSIPNTLQYCKELRTTTETYEYNVKCITDVDINLKAIEELSEALETTIMKKSSGYGTINIELIKYAELALHYTLQLLKSN